MDKKRYIWIDEPEVSDDAYDFIFSQSDSIEYLSEYQYGFLSDIADLKNTELAPLIPALTGVSDGESYGMRGKIYAFALTGEVKELVKGNRLQELRCGDAILQNGSLFRGKKKLFSCCSHEGIEDYDKRFERELAEVCCRAIEKSERYKNAAAIFAALPPPYDKSDGELTKAMSRLSSLENYVTGAWQAWLRFAPDFECTYEEYSALADIFLSDAVKAELRQASSFKALYPQGYPQKIDDIERFLALGAQGFNESSLCHRIGKELRYLYYAADKLGRKTAVDHGDAGPTIIINS